MPKPVDEDRARRKALLEQKRAARRTAKEEEERQKQAREQQNKESNTIRSDSKVNSSTSSGPSPLLSLPEESLHVILSCLSAAELGRLMLTSRSLNLLLPNARIPYLLSRLHRPHLLLTGTVGFINLCSDQAQARMLLEQSHGGGDTGRLVPRGKYSQQLATNDFIAYARFIEESVTGYSILSSSSTTSNNNNNNNEPNMMIRLPAWCQGRFASVSPEHSLCRRGGDGTTCGAGGSGVASWGVGKRGQLGHGKRQDERVPRMLHPGFGFANGIRIVQVSAGGGLVRVAHSLLLTSTGRVLSFGTGQYGALGHGFSAAKQLPDVLRPKFIDFGHVDIRCVCVSAGELHSAAVTTEGDLYTWGDGFCGQLGHGDKRPQVSPKQVVKGGLQDEIVASVSCGSRHSIAVTEDGIAFSFGLGHFGVLGRSFTPFDYDADSAVVNFAVGENGTIAGAPVAAPPVAAPPGAAQPAERDMAAELMAHLDLIANLSLDDSSDQCIPKPIDSLSGVQIVGSSAGHRHSLLLDENGGLYSCGSGACLGHGDTLSQSHPMRISSFDDDGVRIRQMSAGVDISMAVSTEGDVYAWGRTDGGRIGLGLTRGEVLLPRRVTCINKNNKPVKAVDVECGYVHSLIVGLDGTLHMCGGVGVEGESDGQRQEEHQAESSASSGGVEAVGQPRQVPDFNIWHRIAEPKEQEAIKERYSRFGKYEVRGRSKMLNQE